MASLIVLALNSGSSSLKFGVYRALMKQAELVCEGEGEEIGQPHSTFWFRATRDGEKQRQQRKVADAPEALALALSTLKEQGAPMPEAIGHRVVHGGTKVRDHARITPDVVANLREAIPFAPLHIPASLHLIEECEKQIKGVPQVACLDTTFHRDMPDVSRTLPLPAAMRALGLQRFGFHGLSVQSIVDQTGGKYERMAVAHLGGGCSVTAVRNGHSLDTTMGFTPTGGIMMATRPGDLDPGALVFLARHAYNNTDKLEHMLNHDCGLLGISETTNDMRELIKMASSDERAALARRMFSYQLKKSIAGMAVALGGLDGLVLTGGIGENDADLREELARDLRLLGEFAIVALPSREEETMAKITAGVCASRLR